MLEKKIELVDWFSMLITQPTKKVIKPQVIKLLKLSQKNNNKQTNEHATNESLLHGTENQMQKSYLCYQIITDK